MTDQTTTILTGKYSFNERSQRVRRLQQLLGVKPDGWYGRQTRRAHLATLAARGLSTTNVPAIPAAPASVGGGRAGCSKDQAISFAHSILDRHGIPVPKFVIDQGRTRSAYYPGTSLIRLEPCESSSGVAHEIGHYVMDLANGMNFAAHKSEARAFAGGGWIKGSELYPGIEYAAHCVGNQLWGWGAYTKCPNERMAAHARQVIDRAG